LTPGFLALSILEMNGDSFRLNNSRKKKDPGPQ